jgi:Uma2 family endonuclease
VPASEYLNTAYHPDVEYVDGVLLQRSLPTILHSLLQALLCAHFRKLELTGRFKALREVRTEIVKLSRYRIPDLLLCAMPVPKGRVVDVAPLAVIEILSPSDKMGETLERFREYASIGTRITVQMDPEKSIAHRFDNGSLIETRFTELDLGDRTVPFDSDALFGQLHAEHRHATDQE